MVSAPASTANLERQAWVISGTGRSGVEFDVRVGPLAAVLAMGQAA